MAWRERGPGGEGPGRWHPPILPLLFLAALPLAAQPAPRLEVTLKPSQVTVGDPVEAVLTLRVPAGQLGGEPRFPVWGTSWGDAEVRAKNDAVKTGEAGGMTIWQQRITLAAFRTGKVDLPPVQAAVPLKDRTVQAQSPAGLSLDVRSVLPPGEKDPKAKPPAPLKQLPIGAAFWWTLAALSALCALLYWALWRQGRRKTVSDVVRPQLAPFDELAAALDSIDREPSMLRLHTRLSLALRQYLSRALAVPALESTTSEVHRRLVGRRVPAPLVRQTVEILRACDLVKFARQEVGASLGHERVTAARRLARDLDRFAQPPASLPGDGAGDAAERLEATG